MGDDVRWRKRYDFVWKGLKLGGIGTTAEGMRNASRDASFLGERFSSRWRGFVIWRICKIRWAWDREYSTNTTWLNSATYPRDVRRAACNPERVEIGIVQIFGVSKDSNRILLRRIVWKLWSFSSRIHSKRWMLRMVIHVKDKTKIGE